MVSDDENNLSVTPDAFRCLRVAALGVLLGRPLRPTPRPVRRQDRRRQSHKWRLVPTMRLEIPATSLVCLVGSTGAGKSTFARKHFKPTEVLSSDFFRAMIGDDENNLAVTTDAFRCLRVAALARLKGGLLTGVDATSLKAVDRSVLLAVARTRRVPAVAVVLDPGLEVCLARNRSRTDRGSIPDQVLRSHDRLLRRSLETLPGEGFLAVHVLTGQEAIESAEFERVGGGPGFRPAPVSRPA
jgi:predicted kinase